MRMRPLIELFWDATVVVFVATLAAAAIKILVITGEFS